MLFVRESGLAVSQGHKQAGSPWKPPCLLLLGHRSSRAGIKMFYCPMMCATSHLVIAMITT